MTGDCMNDIADMVNRVVCGDSLVLLKELPDKSVDLIFADPPYNVGKDYGESTDDEKPVDAYVDWCKQWFSECRRVSKYAVVITPSIVYVPEWVGRIERTHKVIVWVKENNCSRNYIGKTSGYQCYEPILVYGKPNKCILRDVYNYPISIQPEAEGHPCPKPLKLLKRIVGDFTNENDIVLDPFLGSGTTALAAKLLNRKYIGFEINPDFYEIAKKRLANIPNRLDNFGLS